MKYFNFLTQSPYQIALGLATVTIGLLPAAANAQEIFDNRGIRLTVDTVVEFEFLESNGSYQSIFGIINLDTGEKTPVYGEVRSSDTPQAVNQPSDFQDDLGPQNQDDFYGSPGVTVPEPLEEFRFVAGTEYSFYLESYFEGQPAGTLYSTSSRNTDSINFARFDGPLEDVINGGLLLRWEDTGSLLVGNAIDYDYDDFVIRIGGYLQWDQP